MVEEGSVTKYKRMKMSNPFTNDTTGDKVGYTWDQVGPRAKENLDTIQAAGFSGADKYWHLQRNPYISGSDIAGGGLTRSWWYDYAAEKADQTKYEMAQSGYGSGAGSGNVSTSKSIETTSPQTSTSTQTYTPYGPKPEMSGLADFEAPAAPETPKFGEVEMGEIPEFVAPKYNEAEIAKRTQRYASPGVRKLRSAVQAAMTRRTDNPNVNRLTLKDALAGYGEGLESVMSGASKTATAEYAEKYAIEYKSAGMNWQSAVQAVRDKYAGAMESRKMDFQAELDAVNRVYATSVEAEKMRVSSYNQKVMTEFEAAMNAYLKLGTTTQTTSTSGGEKTRFTQTAEPSTGKYAYLNYE